MLELIRVTEALRAAWSATADRICSADVEMVETPDALRRRRRSLTDEQLAAIAILLGGVPFFEGPGGRPFGGGGVDTSRGGFGA